MSTCLASAGAVSVHGSSSVSSPRPVTLLLAEPWSLIHVFGSPGSTLAELRFLGLKWAVNFGSFAGLSDESVLGSRGGVAIHGYSGVSTDASHGTGACCCRGDADDTPTGGLFWLGTLVTTGSNEGV